MQIVKIDEIYFADTELLKKNVTLRPKVRKRAIFRLTKN